MIAALGALLQPIAGQPAWDVRQGHGSFLTFEFGEPSLEIRERRTDEGLRRFAQVRGAASLWIYCCHWRIVQAGAQLAWSEDTDQQIGRATAQLNGQMVTRVELDPGQGRSTFAFDLGGVLETWPYGADPTDEQWKFFMEGEVWSYRADGLCSLHRGDTLPEVRRWWPVGDGGSCRLLIGQFSKLAP